MKLLIFHPVRLPPADYGGVERVVLWLARGLAERGHEVHVAALPGSRLPPGVSLHPVDPRDRSAGSLIGALPRGCELVHFMAPPGPWPWDGFDERLGCPWLLTVHGNGKPGERFPANTVFLSADHARRHGGAIYVFNGLDPDEYRFEPAGKDGAYLFLSRTSWRVKNVRGAIRLCRRAGVRLRVAGGHRPLSTRLAACVRPGIRWIGPVAGQRKAELLARADALVFPVTWDEPFGLVVAEALVSGTPVLASPRGSLPELVTPAVGALPASEEEWIEALRAGVRGWDPERCRAYALERFHFRRMAEEYEGLYGRVCGGERIHSEIVRIPEETRTPS
jgi:glycosyltransferase involved in cell wall biosynthesis